MVKVRSAGPGRSEGTISTSQMQGVDPKLDSNGIPAPPNAKAVSVVEAIDPGKRNKQVLFITRNTYNSVLNYYQSNLNAGGWKLLQEQSSLPEQTNERATVRMYSRGQQQLDVAIGFDVSKQITIINANLVNFTDK
jgi:hypothetical protein